MFASGCPRPWKKRPSCAWPKGAIAPRWCAWRPPTESCWWGIPPGALVGEDMALESEVEMVKTCLKTLED